MEISLKGKILIFLYSNKNIVGSILGLFGLILYFGGIIKKFWLMIVIGLYLIGYLITPNQEKLQLEVKEADTIDEIKKNLDVFIKKIEKKISNDILTLLNGIKTTVFEILDEYKLRQDLILDQNFFTVKQTVLKYLPSLMESYIRLPWSMRKFHVIKDGKTPHEIIKGNLILLNTKLKEIALNLHENKTQELLMNSKFLEEKFNTVEYLKI